MIWYSPDGSQNWIGQDWKAATKLAMQHGGARVDPSWATPAYAYYGGVPASDGLFLSMGGPHADVLDSPLNMTFGDGLRLERRR